MWILGTNSSDQSAKGRPPHYSATEPFYQPSLMARLPRHLRGAKAIWQELRACCANSGRLKLHPAPLQEDLLGKLAGATTLSNQRSLASWFARSQHQRHQIPQLLHTLPRVPVRAVWIHVIAVIELSGNIIHKQVVNRWLIQKSRLSHE